MAPNVTDRQTDRQTDRVTDRVTDGHTQVITIPTKRLFQRRFAVKMIATDTERRDAK